MSRYVFYIFKILAYILKNIQVLSRIILKSIYWTSGMSDSIRGVWQVFPCPVKYVPGPGVLFLVLLHMVPGCVPGSDVLFLVLMIMISGPL
jgi:hypothetical protein